MPTDRSIAEVEELKSLFGDAKLIISTDYRGLTVVQLSALRAAVRESGASYRVAKNTLVKIASAEIDRPQIGEIVVGPTGFVVSANDPVGPARALLAYIAQNRLDVAVNGAYVDGRIVDGDRVRYLATLPGRDELVAKLLGQMNAPIANLVSVLAGTIRGFMTVLQAHIDKVGNAGVEASTEGAAAAVADAPQPEAGPPAAEAAGDAPVADAGEDPATEGEVSGDGQDEEADEEKPAE